MARHESRFKLANFSSLFLSSVSPITLDLCMSCSASSGGGYYAGWMEEDGWMEGRTRARGMNHEIMIEQPAASSSTKTKGIGIRCKIS